MTKFRISAYQHLIGYMWIYTPHYYSNSFNCSIWLPLSQFTYRYLISVKSVFPSTKLSYFTQSNALPHRIHYEHWIIRGIFIRLTWVPYRNLLLICEDIMRIIPDIRGRFIPQWRMPWITVSSHIYFYRVAAKMLVTCHRCYSL
jgi:hypothetical protein